MEGRSSSIFGGVVDVEVIEPPCRPVTPEPRRVGGDLGIAEKGGDMPDIVLRHLFLDTVGAEAGDSAGYKDLGLVDRVAEVVAGIAADDQRARLAHETAHMPDRP